MARYTDHYSIKFDADTQAAQQRIITLQQELNKVMNMQTTSKSADYGAANIQRAAVAAQELKVHLQAAINTKTGKIDLTKLNQSLKTSGKTLSQYQAALSKIGPTGQAAFRQMALAVMTAEQPVLRLSKHMKNFATTLVNTAKWQLSSSMIHGFTRAISTAYNYTKGLNKSLNNIRIVTGQTVDQMERFADKANKAAKMLSATTRDYTDAALIFYQQGLNDKQVEERTNAVIKMANVTGESAEEVSSYMTAIWNNFADGSKNLEYYSDVMTALGAATASSTDEIAQGLDKFAAIADTVGLSFEYATTSLATVVAETRQSADVVGNSFKTIFSRLEGLTLGETLEDGTTLNKYSQALAAVGVNIKDQNGDLKTMDTIIDELGTKWGDLKQDQQVALAQSVAGTRQYAQFITLLSNYEKFKENLQVANEAEGTLTKQAEIYAESWEAASDRVKASAESIYESIFSDSFFIGITNMFGGLLDSIGLVTEGLGGMAGLIAPIGYLITNLFGQQIASAITSVQYSLKGLTDSGKAELNALRAEASQGLTAGYGRSGSTASKVSQTVVAELDRANQTYVANENRLTDAEKTVLSNTLSTNQQMADKVLESAEKVDEAANKYDQAAEKIMLKPMSSNKKDVMTTSKETSTFMDALMMRNQAAGRNRGYSITDSDADLRLVSGNMGNLKEDLSTSFMENTSTYHALRQTFGGGAPGQDLVTDMQNGNLSNPENLQSTISGLENISSKLKEIQKQKGLKFFGQAEKDVKQYLDSVDGVVKKLTSIKNLEEEIRKIQSKKSKTKKPDPELDQREAELKKQLAEQKKDFVSSKTNKDFGKKAQKITQQREDALRNAQTSRQVAAEQFGKEDPDMVKDFDAYDKSAETLATNVNQSADATNNFKSQIDMSIMSVENFANKTSLLADKMVGFGTSLSTYAMGINALKSLGSIWSDEDATTGEKIVATMMSLSMVLPMVGKVLKSNLLTKTKDLAISKLKEVQDKKEVTLTKTKTALIWLEAMAESVKNAIKQYGVMIGLVVGAAALVAIGTMIASTAAIKDETNALVEKGKAEEEAANKSKEAVNKLKESYDALSDSFEKYLESAKKVQDLKTGTEEWTDALKEANEEARDLLLKYPELAKYASFESGAINFDQVAVEEYKDTLEDNITKAENATSALEVQAKRTTNQAEFLRLRDESISTEWATNIAEWGSGYFTSASHPTHPEEYTGINRDQIVADAIEYLSTNPAGTKEEFSEYFSGDKLIPEDFVNALWENKDALIKNAEVADNLNKTANLVYTQIAKDIYKNNDIVQNSTNKDAFYRLGGEMYQEAYEKKMKTMDRSGEDAYDFAYNWWFFGDNLDDAFKDNMKDYLAAQYGVSAGELSDIKWGETEDTSQKVSFKIGNQTYEDIEITSADLASYEANIEATKAANDAITALNTFINGTTGSLAMKIYGASSAGDLTQEELNQYAEMSEDDWEALKTAAAAGGIDVTKFEEMRTEIEGLVEATQKARDSAKEGASEYIKGLFETEDFVNLENNIGEQAHKSLISNLESISTQFGKEAGEDYLKALNSIPNEELRERLAEIDVTADGSSKAIEELAKEYNLSEQETINLVRAFDDFQIAIAQTKDTIVATVAAIIKSTAKLKTNDTIEQKDYDHYANIFGDNIDDYFVKMADGTYKLVAEASSFQAIAKEATEEWALKTRGNIEAVRDEFIGQGDILSEEYVEGLTNTYNDHTANGSEYWLSQNTASFKLLQASGIDITNLTVDENGSYLLNDAYLQKVKEAQDVYKAADTAIGGLTDSVGELNVKLKTGTITQEDYDANIRQIAVQYPKARDALNRYNKAVRDHGKNSREAKQAQRELNLVTEAAQYDEMAREIYEADQKLKDLTAGTSDYIEQLEKQAAAINKAFGTAVDSTFMGSEAVQALIDQWIAGGEAGEAAGNQLYHMSQQYGASLMGLLQEFGLADEQITSIVNAWDNLTFDVEGNADLSNLMTILGKAGLEAEQVARILAMIGETHLVINGISYDASSKNGLVSIMSLLNGGAELQVTGIAPNLSNIDMKSFASSSGGGGKEKKKVEDEVERYHEISRELAALERQTSSLGKAKDSAFGLTKVALIDEETKALERELNVLEQMDNEILNYLSQDKANIAQFGAEFDEYGNISNYTDMVTKMVKAYNSGAISEERYEEFKKYLEKYEESIDKWWENQEAKVDKEREIVSKKLEAIDTKLEIKLELSEMELSWIEHQLDRLADKEYNAAKSLDLLLGKLNTAKQDSAAYHDQIADIYALAEENKAKGLFLETDGFDSSMKDDLKAAMEGLMQSTTSLLDTKEQIDILFGNSINEMVEDMDTQLGRFDSYTSILGHYTTILNLSGKSVKDAGLIINLGNKSVETSIDKLESARKKQEALEASLATAQAEYDKASSESAKEYWQNEIDELTIQVEESKEQFLASFEETLQAAADNFASAVEQVVAVFESSITQFNSLAIASDQYEKQKTLAEQFLDANTRAYELSKLMRNINNEIAKTDNIAAKHKLKDVLEEINEIQANNAELTQYDLDMLNAKYELRLAEIALEEAQNAKNQVRLTQTAGGGWGYVYTADEEKLNNAEQNYEDKLYNIQKLSDDRIAELSDNILANYEEFSAAIGALRAEEFESEAAFLAEVERITQYHADRDKYLHEQMGIAVKDAGKTYSDTLIGQIEGVRTWEEAHSAFMSNAAGAVDAVTQAYDTWKEHVEAAHKAAGDDTESEQWKNELLNDAEQIKLKANEVKESVEGLATTFKTFIEGLANGISDFYSSYEPELNQIVAKNDKAITDLQTKIKNLQLATEKLNNTELKTPTTTEKTPAAGTSGGRSGAPSPSNTTETYRGTAKLVLQGINGGAFIETASSTKSKQEAEKLAKEALFNKKEVQDKFSIWFQDNLVGSNNRAQFLDPDQELWNRISTYDTGGYTGEWGSSGKLAMLHEKEIILNKQDTRNLLSSIEIVRSIASQLDSLNQYAKLFDLTSLFKLGDLGTTQQLEQNVHITAEFPDVQDHNEIELALSNLINYSSQYINRYNK